MGNSGTGKVKTLKTKLLIGLLPTLVILVALGLWAIVMFYRLGNNIDVILRENYRSVLAVEGMKEAIDRMDSGLLFEVIEQVDTSHAFVVNGRTKSGREQFDRNRPLFEKNLETELGNITVEGEQELADALQRLFRQYLASADRFFALPPAPPGRRAELYYRELFPTFSEIKTNADEVLRLNHDNMKAMDRRARENASDSIRLMIVALIAAVVLTLWASLRLNRSILDPIHAVTDGARAVARGELDQIVPAASRDELGDLAHAFNEMARTIRDYRQAGTARLLRAEERPGDNRFVSRSRGGRRPGRVGRAGQSRGAPAAQRHSGGGAPRPVVSARTAKDPGERCAGRTRRLPPTDPGTSDPAPRRRSRTLLLTTRGGDPNHAGRVDRRGGCAP